MPMPTSAIAYSDCYQFLDAALEDPLGARVWKGPKEAAENFRFRCNYARKVNRDDNAKTYEKGHQLHGRSAYDCLKMTLREDTDGKWWVYAEQVPDIAADIQPLSESEDASRTN